MLISQAARSLHPPSPIVPLQQPQAQVAAGKSSIAARSTALRISLPPPVSSSSRPCIFARGRAFPPAQLGIRRQRSRLRLLLHSDMFSSCRRVGSVDWMERNRTLEHSPRRVWKQRLWMRTLKKSCCWCWYCYCRWHRRQCKDPVDWSHRHL